MTGGALLCGYVYPECNLFRGTVSTQDYSKRMRDTASLRAGVYSRQSKDEATSIDGQTTVSLRAAAERGWTIVGTYSDGTSASRFGRRTRLDWHRLLEDLDAGLLDVVVAWEPSRADRNLETWVTFVSHCRARGVLVHLTGDDDTLDPHNPSHWHRLITGGVDAALESEKISKRVRRGTALAAAAGKPHGPAPFGYERVIVGERQTPSGPKPIKDQRAGPDAPVVVEIFERIARNDPISAIVRDLQQRGVRTPTKDVPWTRNAVKIIARNIAYRGQRRHRSEREGRTAIDERYEATWPPLVDADLFHRAQAVLDQPDRMKTKPGAARHLLSYIGTAVCGRPLHMAAGLHGREGRYHCLGHGCVSVGVTAADEYVTRAICARLARQDVRDLLTPDNSAAKTARAEAADLRARLDQHYDEAADGRLSAGGLAAMERRLLPAIEAADRRALPAVGSGAIAELITAAEIDATRVRPAWDCLPVAGRREVVAQLVQVVVGAGPLRLTRWSTDEDRLLVAEQRLLGSRWAGDELTWGELT